MKKGKLITCLLLLGIIIAIPSFVYLLQNCGNISGYTGEFSYFLNDTENYLNKYGAVIFAWTVILMFIVYLKLIKHSHEFKGIKNILITAFVVGMAFVATLPNTSKDVFFYMGNGRLIDKYDENPYITSISEVKDIDSTDSILRTVGDQSEYKFVYGPAFLTICGLLSKISLSSVSMFLYEFKILNLIAYLITTYLIYKLTKKKKLTIAFCFNPLVLLEVLVNCHNDIFVVLFALIGILLVKEAEKTRKKSFLKSEITFICALMFIVFSALIKYIAILILPFVIIYRLRKEGFCQKILDIMLYFVVILGMFVLPYIPYLQDIDGIFSGVIAQSGKLKDSIYMIVATFTGNNNKIVSYCYSVGFFVLFYVFIIKVLMQIFRKNDFKKAMENTYIILFWTIFIGLTNLTSWYLLWLFIPVFWTSGKKLKNFIWIGFLYELTYTIFYFTKADYTYYQIWILPFIMFMMVLRGILGCFKSNNRKLKENG